MPTDQAGDVGTLGQLQQQAKDQVTQAATPGISFAPTGLEQTQQMAQASTGRAASQGTDVAMTNLGEQAVQAKTAQKQAELQQSVEATTRTQQADEMHQYMRLQDQELDTRNQALKVRQQFNSQLSSLLEDFKQRGDELDLNKQKAQVEQAGQLLRLQNDKYVSNLKLEGARSRLDNEAAFRMAAIQSQFESQLTLTQDDFSFKTMLNADEREFKIHMEQMGYDTAMEIMDKEMQGMKDQALWRGAGSAAEAAIQAGAKYASSQESGVSATGEQLAQSGITLHEDTNTQGEAGTNYTYTSPIPEPVSPMTGIPYTTSGGR